jgi:hypothetical protein
MHRLAHATLCFVLAACAAAAAAAAGGSTVRVDARRNPGDVPYKYFWEGQKQLRAWLPSEPRLLDFSYRILFTELTERQSDVYLPRSWGVSVVGSGIDEDIKVRRGGYFTLDYLQDAIDDDESLIMFKEQTATRSIGVAWVVRVGAGQRMAYADLRKAISEVHGVQLMITPANQSLRTVKRTAYDGLKACFLAPDGDIRIDGAPGATGRVGNCLLLKYDPTLQDSGKTIEFVGPLDIVTLVETRL